MLDCFRGSLCAALTYQALCSANSSYLGIPGLLAARFHLYLFFLCHSLENSFQARSQSSFFFCVFEDHSPSLLYLNIFKTIASYILFVGFVVVVVVVIWVFDIVLGRRVSLIIPTPSCLEVESH